MTITHIISQTRTTTTETAAMQPEMWEQWEEAENHKKAKENKQLEKSNRTQPFFHIFSMCSTHCLTARTAETGELHFKVTSLEPQRVWATAATDPSKNRGFIEGFNQQTWTFHDISPWSVRYSDSGWSPTSNGMGSNNPFICFFFMTWKLGVTNWGYEMYEQEGYERGHGSSEVSVENQIHGNSVAIHGWFCTFSQPSTEVPTCVGQETKGLFKVKPLQ